MGNPKRNRHGRENKLAQRATKDSFLPCPPGAYGADYKPLSELDMRAIFEMAMKILSQVGIGEVPDRLRSDLRSVGAGDLSDDRMSLPPALVQAAINSAAKSFPLHGRDDSRTITVGENRVFFGTGGAAVQTLDIETGCYRPSTLQDLHDFTRLQDTLTNVSWFTRCCIATDIEDSFDLDVNTAFALLKNTTKPVGTAFTQAEHVRPIVEMLDIAAGGKGMFVRKPFLKAHISPIISPLRFGADAVEVVYECIAHNIPISCITAAQSGATAPATLAGFLAQSLAETLCSLVMVHAIRPGFPMIFSNWPFVIDLRTGAFSGGNGETALLNAASAQLSNWLGLPSGVAASMTDAKAVDSQHGMEKAQTSLAAALAGGNLIYESSGMTAALLGASFEAFVLDNEMHAATYRILRGIEVNARTLDFDGIKDAVLGEGHFLGAPATYDAMERDYFYPSLADRADPQSWESQGSSTAWTRANSVARDILASHHPNYICEALEEEIRAQFNILM